MQLKSRLFVSAAAGAALIAVLVAQAQQPPAPAGIFSAVQAQAGRGVYDQNCAGCHGANFEGSGSAPSLADATFLLNWRGRIVSELFGEIIQNMPPQAPGSLSEAAGVNVVAYILQRNGATVGTATLTTSAAMTIGSVAVGAPRGGANAGPVRVVPQQVLGAGSSTARGVSVAGEVKNYVPVTLEMLRNPPASDWLIMGRDYKRHSYSPLSQINTTNVRNLQLKWSWAINNSGANETTPIVHNGIIYLVSPSNILQALDGKTGDLIWETRVGPNQAPGYGGIRSIAIAEDEIFVPTSNAHMVAVDARNKLVLFFGLTRVNDGASVESRRVTFPDLHVPAQKSSRSAN